MKIIHVITSFDIGGAEKVAINIARSSTPNFRYYIIEVVKGNSDFTIKLKKELKEFGISYFSSPFKNKKIAICLFWIRFLWIYVIIKPDIIHSHTEIPDLSLWIFRKIAWALFWIHPHYVRTIHNTQLWNKWNFIGSVVEKFYIKHHSNIAISLSTQNCYAKVYGGEAPPIIYNGLQEVKQERFPNLKSNKINILFAGRFEYQKGVDELIAVATALEKDEKFFFHIIGDGSMKEKLYSAIERLRNVAIYPKIYGLSTFLGSFDFLFMPSNHEGLALMSIEASFAHTPTIINSCPGLKDTLPADWELSVEDNSIKDFIGLFSRIQEFNYSYLCDKSYNYAKKHFSIEKMQYEYERLYEQQK